MRNSYCEIKGDYVDMFSVEKFYEDANNGNEADIKGMCQYLNSYANVVIWGAGNLGTAVGKKLNDLGVHISAYWDAHYKQIKEKKKVFGVAC